MRVLMVLLALAVTPLVAVAAQSRDDKCADPRGRAVGHSQDRTGKRGNAYGHDKTRGVVCPPDAPPLPPPPPPPGEDPPPAAELAEIHGTAFGDLDFSFTRSPGETGLAGWTITLSGPVLAETLTDADGNYSFVGLPPGTYLICEVPQIGWMQTAPMDGPDCVSGNFGYTRVVSPDAPGVRFIGNDFGNWLIQ